MSRDPDPGAGPTRERDKRPLDLAIIRRLWTFTRPHAPLRNALFGFVVLRALQLPILAWAIASTIGGPIAHRNPRGTLLAVLGFVTFAAFTQFCFVYRMRFALRLGEQVVHDLRNRIYAHLLRLPMAFFERVQTGRLIGRLTSDVDVVRVGVQDVAFVSAVQAGNLLVSAGLMVAYDGKLFLVVLFMAPALWAVVRAFRKSLSAAYRAQQESFSRVTASLAESVNGIREIQAFARQDVTGETFGRLVHDHSQYNMGAARRSAVFQPLLEFNGQLFLSILLVLGGHQVLVREVPIGVLIQFLFLSNAFFAAIPNIGNQYNQALTAMAGAERVFSLLDTTPDWEDAADATELPAPSPSANVTGGRVELKGVDFAYQPGRPVLQGIALTAEPGQTVALVGHTGSGKSTLVKLIAKLYLPTAGEVLIDGHEIRRITSASLHRQIASVTQENILFSGTIADNIRIGRPDATDEDIQGAARSLDVLDLILGLPAGFATNVGEKGSGLSLGQRQVVCFARALLANPRILILDEATSAIDSITESRIQRALARLLAGRTSFVIAHRLSTIRHADQVIVVDHGHIADRGTHRELMRRGGQYARMVHQFAANAITE